MSKTPKKLCGARLRAIIRHADGRVEVRRRAYCSRPALENGRCRHHGGRSTGPTSEDGMQRLVAARMAYIEREKAAGRKLPWGRPRRDDPRHIARRAAREAEAKRREAAEAIAALTSKKGDVEAAKKLIPKLREHLVERLEHDTCAR